MSYSIIIDNNGTSQSISVDRLRVKNYDGRGTTDYAPRTRYPYGKLIVYRNGTYDPADYGLLGFTAVEERINEREDGRSCDIVLPEAGGGAAASEGQSIEIGGRAHTFSAGGLNVRMGASADTATIMPWYPIEAPTVAQETTTITTRGTHRPGSGGGGGAQQMAFGLVTVADPDETPGQAYTVGSTGNLIKIRRVYTDHFWAFMPKKEWDGYITYERESYCIIKVKNVMVARASEFSYDGDETVTYHPYNAYYISPNIIIPTVNETQTRKSKKMGYRNFPYANWTIKTSFSLKIYLRCPRVDYYKSKYDAYNNKYLMQKKIMYPEYMLSRDYIRVFDGAVFEDDDIKISMRNDSVGFIYCDIDIKNLKVPYYGKWRHRENRYAPFVEEDVTASYNAYILPSGLVIPSTDILYLGDYDTANDWAKTITEADL